MIAFLLALAMIWGGSITRLCAVASVIPGKTEMLSSTLALPTVYFKDPQNIDAWISQYHELKKFIHKIHPGAEILITRKGEPPKDLGWEQLPFTWNNMSVWIRRHSIYDNIHDYYERLDTSA